MGRHIFVLFWTPNFQIRPRLSTRLDFKPVAYIWLFYIRKSYNIVFTTIVNFIIPNNVCRIKSFFGPVTQSPDIAPPRDNVLTCLIYTVVLKQGVWTLNKTSLANVILSYIIVDKRRYVVVYYCSANETKSITVGCCRQRYVCVKYTVFNTVLFPSRRPSIIRVFVDHGITRVIAEHRIDINICVGNLKGT